MISEWVGSDRVGSVIEGRFHLQRWLGGAGESGVFLTQIGRPPQNAAIKIIPAGIADADALLDQWNKAKHRNHGNLIQLFHAGYCRVDDCDLLYAVTDRADEILSDVLRVRPLTTAEVREMLDPLLETLSWLHGQNLVHGCLKPSNVMVVNEQIKLSVDRIQPAGPRIFPVLSPGVQDAPESAGRIAPAADIWSLGVLLIEALTQELPPWDGNCYRIPASVPQPFAAIASECLRLDPARRCSLREIRSRLAPAPRAAAPAALVSTAPVSAEPTRVEPDPPTDSLPAEPPPDRSPDRSSDPAPDLLPIPSLATTPELVERVAALLDPAAPVETPAAPEMPPPVPDAPPSAPTISETVESEGLASASEALLSDAQAETAAPILPEHPETVPEQQSVAEGATEQPVAESAPEFVAESASEKPVAESAPGPVLSALEKPSVTIDPGASAKLLALAAQRRASIPAAEPVKAAQKVPVNRRATLVASAMVLIAAGLMVTIGLRRSKLPSLPAARPSAASQPPVSTKASPQPQVQAAVPPASVAALSAAQTAAASIPTGPTAPGAVVDRVLPHVTQYAMDTIRGRLVVIVRVQVDANGNVSDASYDYEGTSHYLKTAALKAAWNWKFQPAQIGGRPVPSTWDLQFWFGQSGPSVIAVEKTS